VNDLLKLARLEAGPARAYQPLELCTLGSEAVARGKALCGCSVFADCPGTVWAYGDPDALTQALLNLVRNAADHTPSTGEIVVSVRPEGTEAVIRVTDSGSGLRAEDLPHLFDRFYRASGPRSTHSGGSGLGLAITRRLVELHGGSVAAANREDGRGAVFTIRLPRIEEPDTEE
jgi:signal transduction histidine kinase